MWARHIEVMLACWLAVTPFVFEGDSASVSTRVVSWTSAAAVMTFSLVSYWPPARRAYLLTALTGLVIGGWAYFAASDPASPVHQNFVVTGLLLMMMGILPCYNNRPPAAWIDYDAGEDSARNRRMGS